MKTSKMLFNTLLLAAAAGVGLAAGLALRGRHLAQAAPWPAENWAVPTGSQARFMDMSKRRANPRPADDSPLATRLERDLSMAAGVTRWLYWLEALEQAGPVDFPRLARLARGNSAVLRLVATRWVALHPRHLFDTLAAAAKTGGGLPTSELAEVLFQEWPKSDPEAVIAALNGPEGLVMRNWRMRVAGNVTETDAERGLRLMSEWRIENYGPRMTAVSKWAAANPRHAAEFTLEHPAGYASRLAMETIGQEWVKTDPGAALEFAAAEPGELGATLATATLKEWAGRHLNAAADWLTRADTRMRNLLSPAFVEAWAKQDAAAALDWCESNLAGSSLAQAVGSALKSVSEKDVAGAAALVAGMNPSPARAEAAAAVAHKWFPDYFADKSVAAESIAWLGSLDADSRNRVLEQVGWRWSNLDPKSMAAFLASPEGENAPLRFCSDLARSMVRGNPLETLEWTSQLPENRGLQAGSDAFNTWWRAQPESAIKWLSDLSSTDSRREPFVQNVTRSMALDPHGPEQLAQFPAADQSIARGVIEGMAIPAERRAKLLEVLKPR